MTGFEPVTSSLHKDALYLLSYIGTLPQARRATLRRTASRLSRQNAVEAHSPRPAALPHAMNWSGRRGSNPRPTAWKAVTLPLSYSRLRGSCRRGIQTSYTIPPAPAGREWWRGEDSNLRSR